jgi:feruloyl esterase
MDLIESLENWVERGRAPDELKAARINNDPGIVGIVYFPLKADEIEMTRPVYPYPEVARYGGTGDPNRAENFRRAVPN